MAYKWLSGLLVLTLGWMGTVLADAGSATRMGMTTLPQPKTGVVTVFYPTQQTEREQTVGPFHLSWARDAQPVAGNGRLVVISHGSGGSPWVHADLARELVQRGFVVAVPQHQGDNHQDPSQPGPVSWDLRPREISETIDTLAASQPFFPWLRTDAVGLVGGSAGGHTVLSLAGGQWSPQRFRDHCRQYIRQDFSSCVGMLMLLKGNAWDDWKVWRALRVIDWRFDDPTLRKAHDPRIRVGVAMVPFAADFNLQTLVNPVFPLGLVRAGQDINQVPKFHMDAVLGACLPRCTLLVDWPEAGHGLMLSPTLAFPEGSVAKHLLADPAGFDRPVRMAQLNQQVVAFLTRHLGL